MDIQDRRLCESFIFFHCELHIEENYLSYKAYQFTCAFIQNFSRFFFIMQFIILLGMAYGYIMFINGMNIKHFTLLDPSD